MRINHGRGLTSFQKSVLAWKRRIRHRTRADLTVSDGRLSAMFRCQSAIEERRAESLFEKEPGTIDWLSSFVKPGQVFVDVGANIGIYTVLAGQLVGSAGNVYAFEPHVVNFCSLLQNITLNGLERWCVPFSCALTDKDAYLPFHYASLAPGSSMSQLEHATDPDGNDITGGVTEVKAAISIDALLDKGLIKPPHHVKIDVDGIEASVVRGMKQLLTGSDAPLSVQVEVQPDTLNPVRQLMNECQYQPLRRHDTAMGAKNIANGAKPDDVTHNIIFTPSER